jgi:hypothetical protein
MGTFFCPGKIKSFPDTGKMWFVGGIQLKFKILKVVLLHFQLFKSSNPIFLQANSPSKLIKILSL